MSDSTEKVSRLSCAATALAVLSCYGTLLLIGLLSLLGVSLALDERIWAGTISTLAVVATVAIAASYRRHRIVWPTAVAALGLGLILWVMHGSYDGIVEAAGFALLVAATAWDWKAGTRRGTPGSDGVSWIDAAALAERLDRQPGPVIVDVRGPDEFDGATGHIRHARNIPVADLARRLPELADLKERELTLVCRTQLRSAEAATLLRNAGFRDVRVLQGGMVRWNELGLPIEGPTASSQT